MQCTYLSSCSSNPLSLPEVESAGDSAPNAGARGRTRRTLPLPARVVARRRDWRQIPRSVPSYCDSGCAGRTGIGLRTTFLDRPCRGSRRCTPRLLSTLLPSLSSGPLPGPTSLSSTVPRLFKNDVVQGRTSHDQVAPKKQKESVVIAQQSHFRELDVSRVS